MKWDGYVLSSPLQEQEKGTMDQFFQDLPKSVEFHFSFKTFCYLYHEQLSHASSDIGVYVCYNQSFFGKEPSDLS